MSAKMTLVGDIPPLTRPTSLAVAATEFGRYMDQLRALPRDAWSLETECAPWTVRDMAAHVLGATESIASIRETAHQLRVARHRNLRRIDALNAVQIDERRSLGPDQIIARLEAASAASIRARQRLPGPVRRMRIRGDLVVGSERWTLAYLMDVVYVRDTWMHRVDTARCTGSPMELTADHDGRIVADVVADWSSRHGRPFELVLSGTAGGHYRSSEPGGERHELDALEFCRRLSGRGQSSQDLLGFVIPF